jgi:hypothetical protein
MRAKPAVLKGAPRSDVNTKGDFGFGGIAGVGHVSAMVSLVFRSRFGAFVSGGKIPFPGNRDVGSKRRGSTV